MKWYLFIFLLIVPFSSAYTYYSNDNMLYSFNNGIVEFRDIKGESNYMTFVVEGTISGNQYIYSVNDFSWNWIKTNDLYNVEYFNSTTNETYNVSYITDIFIGQNNNPKFKWVQTWEFNPVKDMKFSHNITNNFGSEISDMKLWYAFSIPENNNIKFLDKNYIFQSDIDIKQDLSLAKKIMFSNYEFRFKDLVDSNFYLTDFYIGNAGKLGDPYKRMVALAISKGNRILPAGASIIIDPTITSWKSPGEWADPYSTCNNPQHVVSSNNVDAQCQIPTASMDTSNYSFISGNEVPIDVHGIEARIEAAATAKFATAYVSVDLWNGTDYIRDAIQDITTRIDADYYFGDLSDNWGTVWTLDMMTDENFRARINFTGRILPTALDIDHIELRINYSVNYGNPPQILEILPKNNTKLNTTYSNLNILINDTNLIDTIIYGSNETRYLQQSILYRNEDTLNVNLTYNWTAPIVNPSYNGIYGLYHFSSSPALDFAGHMGNITSWTGSVEWTDNAKFGGSVYLQDERGSSFGVGETTVCNDGCTFSVWFNQTQAASDGLLGRGSATNDDRFFDLTMVSLGYPTFRIHENGNLTSCTATNGSSDAPLNEWNHVVGVYSYEQNWTKLFLNGVLINTTICNFQINKTAWLDDESFKIGSDIGNPVASLFTGYIDEVAIWNRTLSDCEIYDLYKLKNDKYYMNSTFYDGNSTTTSELFMFETPICKYDNLGNCELDCKCSIMQENLNLNNKNVSWYNLGIFDLNYNITNYNYANIPDQECYINTDQGGYLTV